MLRGHYSRQPTRINSESWALAHDFTSHSRLGHDSKSMDLRTISTATADRITFSIIDLLARIPEVRQYFEEAFERPAHCYRGRALVTSRSLTVTVWRDRFVPPAADVLRDALVLPPD